MANQAGASSSAPLVSPRKKLKDLQKYLTISRY
jgi:hypothetical protein